MREKIEKAIRETLVVENSQSIKYAVDKIMKLYSYRINDLHDNMIIGNQEGANNILKELLELPF